MIIGIDRSHTHGAFIGKTYRLTDPKDIQLVKDRCEPRGCYRLGTRHGSYEVIYLGGRTLSFRVDTAANEPDKKEWLE